MLLVETYIAESPGKGKGLFSKNFIPKGTTIWEFVEEFDIKVHKDKYKLLSQIQKDFIDTYFWKPFISMALELRSYGRIKI